jgi:hypothetical protein
MTKAIIPCIHTGARKLHAALLAADHGHGVKNDGRGKVLKEGRREGKQQAPQQSLTDAWLEVTVLLIAGCTPPSPP